MNQFSDFAKMHADMAHVAQPNFAALAGVARGANHASDFYERLVDWIVDFEKGLDEHTEIGARLVNFGQTLTFHLRDMGYYNPSLICFYGEDDQGHQLQLIQHVSQISILLIAMPKTADEPRRIGFHLQGQLNDQEAPDATEG